MAHGHILAGQTYGTYGWSHVAEPGEKVTWLSGMAYLVWLNSPTCCIHKTPQGQALGVCPPGSAPWGSGPGVPGPGVPLPGHAKSNFASLMCLMGNTQP